jgi:hypothetical protein
MPPRARRKSHRAVRRSGAPCGAAKKKRIAEGGVQSITLAIILRREILPRAIVLASPLFGASVEILAQASSEQAMASSLRRQLLRASPRIAT